MNTTNPLEGYTNLTPNTFYAKGENAESKKGMRSVIQVYIDQGYTHFTAANAYILKVIDILQRQGPVLYRH